jgi:hypothetical protein
VLPSFQNTKWSKCRNVGFQLLVNDHLDHGFRWTLAEHLSQLRQVALAPDGVNLH